MGANSGTFISLILVTFSRCGDVQLLVRMWVNIHTPFNVELSQLKYQLQVQAPSLSLASTEPLQDASGLFLVPVFLTFSIMVPSKPLYASSHENGLVSDIHRPARALPLQHAESASQQKRARAKDIPSRLEILRIPGFTGVAIRTKG